MQTTCLTLLLLVVTALGQSDFEALLELKKGFQKDPSEQVLVSWDLKSFSSNGCPQNWYGVVCIDGHVTSITLNNAGLIGNFSFPVLADLKMLQNLSISSNQLTGTISNVGAIKSLEFLDLSCNLFHGFVPSGIANLQNLVLLNLSSNNFQGMLPPGFGNLEPLKYLDLRDNSFSGDIMSLLLQLGSLIHVDLSSNKFSGQLDLGLGNASFVSSIQYINISHNSLVGQLFVHDGMPYFDSLEVFDASNNQLVGELPPFQFVVSLRILRLGSNQLSGSLPEDLLQESSMVLSELDLSLNQLEGPLVSITSATLKKLNLSSNKLSGFLPATVGHCAIIDLSNNMFSGDVSRIQNWGNFVEVIQLSSNSLTGTLPNQTSQFLRLSSLEISNNSLNGNLPLVLGTYPELEVIDLSLNFLTGLLLPTLFTSATLTALNFSGNNFTGSIPVKEIYGPTQNLSLVSLDLSYNNLNGYLPSEISNFHNLVYLNLCHNNLQGHIPGDLPNGLEGFNVSSNNLSGAVPDNLMRFPDSAFHPGNSLLIFPNMPLSPKGAPDVTPKVYQSHMKPAMRIALITGMVAVAITVVLLGLMICYRTHWQKFGERLEEDDGNKSIAQDYSSVSHTPAISRSLDRSLPPFGIHQSLSPPSQMVARCDPGDTSLILNKPKDRPQSIRKDERIPSPMSFLSYSNPSPSKTPHSSENPAMFNVYSPDKLSGDLHLFDSSLAFTADELACAPAEVIGRSCHGTLYKAVLDSGNVLAIKWLKEGVAKGRKEFAREVKKLGSIRHPNLVSIQGYYWGPKEHEKMIISNYMSAQCLTFYLQETEPRNVRPLTLDERLRIAVNIAKCLNYLHNVRAIPHGNIKSMNVLLEPPNMNVLLTDYSLHRILTSAATAEQVLNAGALGYRPPEFANSSKPCPSLKSDVYAFGVILLELVTGRISGEMIAEHPDVLDLTEWVRLLTEKNSSHECFDKLLLDGLNAETTRVLNEVLKVALRCILPASERPDMKSIFEDLSTLL